MSTVFFITHPEVDIDPLIPVEQWSLSAVGVQRMEQMLVNNWVSGITSVHSSSEKKALDGAGILAKHLHLEVQQHSALGENDRRATGYLPKVEFELVADRFFSHPTESVRGWETAQHARNRIVAVVNKIVDSGPAEQSVAIISHGAVGTLLLCHLEGWAINRKHDQPGNGGGNFFRFAKKTREVIHGWRSIDTET